MGAKILRERRRAERIEYEMEFGNPNSAEKPCYSFPCDSQGNPEPFRCKAAEDNYNKVMELAKIDDYYKPHLIEFKSRYTENAEASCECGAKIELWDQYMGASQCEKCGRWHNLFGQTLVDPQYWEADYEY